MNKVKIRHGLNANLNTVLLDEDGELLVTIDDKKIYMVHDGSLLTLGTSNYNDLTNKPKIGDVELTGNKLPSDLGLVSKEYVDDLIGIESTRLQKRLEGK